MSYWYVCKDNEGTLRKVIECNCPMETVFPHFYYMHRSPEFIDGIECRFRIYGLPTFESTEAEVATLRAFEVPFTLHHWTYDTEDREIDSWVEKIGGD